MGHAAINAIEHHKSVLFEGPAAPPTLRVKRLTATARLPARQRPEDAGLDLCSEESFMLDRWETRRVRTGIAVAIPPGHVGLIRDRSGWASVGVAVLGGVVDQGFTGEVQVILHNTGFVPRPIEIGDRVAQLLILPAPAVDVVEVVDLPASGRGTAGFGSTGGMGGGAVGPGEAAS